MTTDKEIIAFLKTATDGTPEEYVQRLQQDIFRHFRSEEDGIAFMLANRLLMIEKPIGIIWAPPRFLSRLKKMSRRLGARSKINGPRWLFWLPGMNVEGEIDYFSVGRPPNNADLIMPWFFFERLPHIEQEADFALAGTLYVDIPQRERKKAAASGNPPEEVKNLIKALCEMAKDGRMDGDNTIAQGWRGPKPPYGDEVTDDPELMREWAKDKLVIVLRMTNQEMVVDDGGGIPMDSDVMLRLGLGRDGKPIQ
jgi:hypothetical protein